jgi:hypothetical protein
MKKFAILGAVALALSAVATVASAGEIYAGVGTQGGVVGAGTSINSVLSARGEFNYLNYNDNYSSDNVNYNAKLKYQNGGVYLDFHPFSNGLRLTAGALVGNDKLDGTANSSQGTYTINGNSYSAAGQSLNATLTFPTVRPYIGIGYGHTQSAGLGFYADLGVAYGKPSVNLNASSGLAAAAASDLAAEQSSLQSKANDLKYMPVLNIGLSYGF